MKLVSACLCGMHCRYDGGTKACASLQRELAGTPMLLVCPESLAGLSAPRPPSVLFGGDGHAVLDGTAAVRRLSDNADLTPAFIQGAEATLALARQTGVTEAILKRKSPSCGVSSCYQDGELRPGMGVAAALLARNGIAVREWDEDQT